MNAKFMVKYILNWSWLSEQAANESEGKLSSDSNSKLERMLLLTNT